MSTTSSPSSLRLARQSWTVFGTGIFGCIWAELFISAPKIARQQANNELMSFYL